MLTSLRVGVSVYAVHGYMVKARESVAWNRLSGVPAEWMKDKELQMSHRVPEFKVPWAVKMCHGIFNLLWVQGRFLCRNDAPAEIQRVSRNLLKEGKMVAGRVVREEGRACVKVLRQQGAQFMRGWLKEVSGAGGWVPNGGGQGDSEEYSRASLEG